MFRIKIALKSKDRLRVICKFLKSEKIKCRIVAFSVSELALLIDKTPYFRQNERLGAVICAPQKSGPKSRAIILE